jgi:hypothetical protein
MTELNQEVPPPAGIVVIPRTKVVMSETTKIMLVLAFGVAVDRLLRSEAVKQALMLSAGAVVVYAWGLWQRLRSWKALSFLQQFVPDETARMGK